MKIIIFQEPETCLKFILSLSKGYIFFDGFGSAQSPKKDAAAKRGMSFDDSN